MNRNAEKDRRQLAIIKADMNQLSPMAEWTEHWLERAISAEQRVAELEKALEEIKDEEWRLAGEFTTIYMTAHSALKGGQE